MGKILYPVPELRIGEMSMRHFAVQVSQVLYQWVLIGSAVAFDHQYLVCGSLANRQEIDSLEVSKHVIREYEAQGFSPGFIGCRPQVGTLEHFSLQRL